MNLASWLRAGRDRRKLSIEDVAKITKINTRVLEKLESGQLDGLPAEVFVKGFVRSYAKCVGLDESEAIEKLKAAQAQGPQPAVAVAKALVETMARPREVATVLEARRIAQGTPVGGTPVEAASSAAASHAAAPLATAPIATAPIATESIATASIATASIATASIATAPIATESNAAAPVEAPLVIETPIEIETPVVEVAAEPVTAGKKKRARKNAKQRNRKRKQAQEQKAAEQDAVETAVFERIDTAPVAKIDAESIEVSSIEAKTTEPLDSVAAPIEDGAVEAPALAAGSQRISQHGITVVEQELADSEAGAATETSSANAMPSASETSASELAGQIASETATEIASTFASPSFDAPFASESASTASDAGDEPDVITSAGTWQPTMPAMATSPSVPWRRPGLPTSTASAYVVPTLVIDDADPDSADRERDDRIAKEPHRLSFLPPILLDREDRSARQGGLTLAVIILLIAATLTLSYLMRRPSPSGDGVTLNETPATLIA